MMSPVKKKTGRPASKTSANKTQKKQRGPNAAAAGRAGKGAPFNEQDSKRRLGNFVGAGEHARRGGRTTGIVGQSKQKRRTDKRSGTK